MARVLRCRHQQRALPFARLGSDKYIACVPFDNVGTTGSALADVLDDFFSSPVGRGRALGLSSAVSHGKLRI